MDPLSETSYTDPKDIEERGLNKFKDYLAYSKRMSQYISENDKSPIWDGHIYLYRTDHKTKDNLVGRIPVQVKGKEVDRFKKVKFMYPIETVDLNSYLTEPTVYVVCQEKKGSMARELFYRFLLPETVKKILDGHQSQKSISVWMKPLPDSDTFEDLLSVFLIDRVKQIGFSRKKSPSLRAVINRGLNFHVSTPGSFSEVAQLFGYLSKSDSFLYANNDDEFGTEVPIDGGPVHFLFSRYEKEPIKIGDRVFFDGYQHEIKNGRDHVIAGDGMLIIDFPLLESDKDPVKLTITCPSHYLDDFIKQGDIVVALQKNKVISIGDCDIDIGEHGLEGDIDQLTANLSIWKTLQETLDMLHVKKRFEVDKLEDEGQRALRLIIDCIHDSKLVRIDNPPEPGIYIFDISNIKLLMCFNKASSSQFFIGDVFHLDVHVSVMTDNGSSTIPSCIYSYLREDNLWRTCDNIDFDNIENGYETVLPKEEGFSKVVEDDLVSIENAISVLEQNHEDSCRLAELKNAYYRLDTWLSKYKAS